MYSTPVFTGVIRADFQPAAFATSFASSNVQASGIASVLFGASATGVNGDAGGAGFAAGPFASSPHPITRNSANAGTMQGHCLFMDLFYLSPSKVSRPLHATDTAHRQHATPRIQLQGVSH